MLKKRSALSIKFITTVTQHNTDGRTAIDGINILFALKKETTLEGVGRITIETTGEKYSDQISHNYLSQLIVIDINPC
jgi:hypothetical protein